MHSIYGKSIIITGSTSGIGLTTAWRLARAGAKVVVIGKNEDKTKEVTKLIKEAGFTAISFSLDITNLGSLKDMTDFVVHEYGTVDVLVNNAAWWGNKPFLEMTFNDFHKWFSEYVEATYFLSQTVANEMIKHQKGNILNIASTAAFYGEYGMSAYCSAKAAIVNLTRAMALELGEFGIRVNCVAPGTTIRNNETRSNEVMEAFRKLTPLGKLNSADDVAKTIAFMCSDDSAGITGQILLVDGGYSSVRMIKGIGC